jgi:hypothetical protein
VASPASGTADLIEQRQLEKAVSWTGRERFRCLWYRLRLTVQEMNYATRRIVELQASWISEEHPRWTCRCATCTTGRWTRTACAAFASPLTASTTPPPAFRNL